jgi:hypothetical protein
MSAAETEPLDLVTVRSLSEAKGHDLRLPRVAAEARKLIDAVHFAERCKVVEGDFSRNQIPSGADAYMLSRLIHDWNGDQNIAIFENCHRAMSENGKLLLVELVLPDRAARSEGSQIAFEFDLLMPVDTNGRERTQAEYRELFDKSGFKLTGVTPTGSLYGYCLIEGTRV